MPTFARACQERVGDGAKPRDPSMPQSTLRPATAADGPVLAALAARLGECALPPWRAPHDIADADARAMLEAVADGDPDNEVLIAERDGTVAGCLHILAVTDFFGLRHAHVSVLATTSAAEGSGVAREMMAFAERWTAQRGLTLLTLNTFAGNARARRFYEIAGFQVEMVKYARSVNDQPATARGTANLQTPKGTANT